MKVKELIDELQKYDAEDNVIIRFALDNEDEIGYVLEPFHVSNLMSDVAIYGAYKATKEDCDFIGQVDLKEAYQKMRE